MMQIGQARRRRRLRRPAGAGTLPRRQSERPSRHPRDLPAGQCATAPGSARPHVPDLRPRRHSLARASRALAQCRPTAALCPGQWKDYRAIYEANFHKLDWQPASFLPRATTPRAQKSDLPHEHYEIAVLRHQLSSIPPPRRRSCRLLFVYSKRRTIVSAANAGKKHHQDPHRPGSVARPPLRGHPQCTIASIITRQVVQLLGKKDAARYFSWQFVPLTPAEQASPAAAPQRPSSTRRTPSRIHFRPHCRPPRNNMTACPCS